MCAKITNGKTCAFSFAKFLAHDVTVAPLSPNVLIRGPPQLMLTLLANLRGSPESRVSTFAKRGRKRPGGATSRGSVTSGFIHPSGQAGGRRSALPALCFIPSSFTIPHFSRRSLFSFRPRHNGGMVMRAHRAPLCPRPCMSHCVEEGQCLDVR